MGIKDRIIERIKDLEDEEVLQQLEQWLETNMKQEKGKLAGNPAHKPKKASELKDDIMFEGDPKIPGGKG